jgi:hypothetical protein
MFLFEWCNVLTHICLFVCACLYSLCVANRLRSGSKLRGIEDQALATKWYSFTSFTRLKTLSICSVKASVLWPIMSYLFIIHCPALYFNQWTWWDTMMILWSYSGYDDILVAFKGTRAVSRVPLCKDLFVERPPGITMQPWGWNEMPLAN